jgi:riboflavin-specific deaminase-like protein
MSLKSKVSGLKSAKRHRAPNQSHRAAKKISDVRPQTSDLPFTFSNFAITADGKIAFTNRQFVPFAGKRDQEHMMELRATADAVMSGARTVDLNPATLGPGGEKYRRQRIKRGLPECNLRIIVRGSGSVDPQAEIFQHKFSPIIVLTTKRATTASRRRLESLGAKIKICGEKEINFRVAFRWLRKKWHVKRLLCEGGGELHDAIIRAGLLDELHLTISPKIFGGRTAPTLADGRGFQKLAAAATLKLKSARRVGAEMFLVYGRIG